LANKVKIPVQKLVHDLTIGISDQNIMDKYGLDYRQLILALGKLAERRMISFKRIVYFVRGYLNRRELEKAEVCLIIIKKYFSKIWGVQAIVNGLEQELVLLKSRKAFQQKMNEKSKTLECFKLEYPEIPLHPAVVSSVKVLDYYTDKKREKEKSDPTVLKLLDTWSRLKIYLKYVHRFAELDPINASRVWHYISLKLFHQENIKHFMIRGLMDVDTRDVCMHLDGTRLSVIKVLQKADEQNKAGKVLSLDCLPVLMNIEDLSMEQKAKVLMENDWYLPPFCENCRCQIVPC
jgi:hypothetical protein